LSDLQPAVPPEHVEFIAVLLGWKPSVMDAIRETTARLGGCNAPTCRCRRSVALPCGGVFYGPA
jgi:hypothetical protein